MRCLYICWYFFAKFDHFFGSPFCIPFWICLDLKHFFIQGKEKKMTINMGSRFQNYSQNYFENPEISGLGFSGFRITETSGIEIFRIPELLDFLGFPFFQDAEPLPNSIWIITITDFCLSMCHFWAFEIPRYFLYNETCTFFVIDTLM